MPSPLRPATTSGIDWRWIYALHPEEVIQDSETLKARWLREAERVFPPGAKGRVLDGPQRAWPAELAGLCVEVVGHDPGSSGEYPSLGVRFAPVKVADPDGASVPVEVETAWIYDDYLAPLNER
jgi:hypothetical protein